MSDNFEESIRAFALELEGKADAAFLGIVAAVHESITVGSPVTGAPGQPVDTGALRNSWQIENIAPGQARISTNLPYAEPIEDGVGAHGPLTLRSAVGGFHSVKMTVAGFPALVDKVVRDLGGANA